MFLQAGQTVLHHAAFGGSADIVDLLLSRHPDMITQTDNVSEQITLFSVLIGDHTWIMMEKAGIVAMTLYFKELIELFYP